MKIKILDFQTEKHWDNAYVQEAYIGMMSCTPHIDRAHDYYDDEKRGVERVIEANGYKFKWIGESNPRPIEKPKKSTTRRKKD